jgi:RNA recognition motif. (a.k.a. RRM, RBD, or RNP domain)
VFHVVFYRRKRWIRFTVASVMIAPKRQRNHRPKGVGGEGCDVPWCDSVKGKMLRLAWQRNLRSAGHSFGPFPATRQPVWSSIRRGNANFVTEASQTAPLPPSQPPELVETRVLFSPILPASMGRWDPRRLLSLGVNMRLKAWLPADIEAVSYELTPREGAALARVRYDKRKYPNSDALLAALKENLPKTATNQLINRVIQMPGTRPFIIQGEPFLEDVISNWTSRTLRVTVFLDRTIPGAPPNTCRVIDFARKPPTPGIKGGYAYPLTLEEEVYSVFRPYGKIDNLLVKGDAVAQAGNVGSATIEFHSIYSAMAAILCVRGVRLPGGRVVHADYIPFLATRTLSNFIKDHTRIALALLALILAGVSIAVLDPIRKLSIKVLAPSMHRWCQTPCFVHIY